MRRTLEGIKSNVEKLFEPLESSAKAVEWLTANRAMLASWAVPRESRDWLQSNGATIISFGVEPGVGQGYASYLNGLRSNIRALAKLPTVRETGKWCDGPWGDQLLKANAYKLAVEVSNALHECEPRMYMKGRNEVGRLFSALGLNVAATCELLQQRGQGNGNGVVDWGYTARRELALGGINWGAAHALMLKGLGEPEGSVIALNISGLWKPSMQYGQFGALLRQGDCAVKETAVLRNNASWYKFSGAHVAQQIASLATQSSARLIYFGGAHFAPLKGDLVKDMRPRGKFSLQNVARNGNVIRKQFDAYQVANTANGCTIAIFGPHPGTRGFSGNRGIMNAVGEIAKGLATVSGCSHEVSGAKVIWEN